MPFSLSLTTETTELEVVARGLEQITLNLFYYKNKSLSKTSFFTTDKRHL